MRRIELPSVWPKPRSSGCSRNSATLVAVFALGRFDQLRADESAEINRVWHV